MFFPISQASPVFDPSALIFWGAIFVIFVVFGVYLVGKIRAWAKLDDDTSQTHQQLLTRLRAAYERGEIEEFEYRMVKEQLARTIRDSLMHEDPRS